MNKMGSIRVPDGNAGDLSNAYFARISAHYSINMFLSYWILSTCTEIIKTMIPYKLIAHWI